MRQGIDLCLLSECQGQGIGYLVGILVLANSICLHSWRVVSMRAQTVLSIEDQSVANPLSFHGDDGAPLRGYGGTQGEAREF